MNKSMHTLYMIWLTFYTLPFFVTVGLCDAPGSGGLWCECSDLQVCSDAHSHCCIWGASWMLAMATPSRCRYQQTGMTSDAHSTQANILYTNELNILDFREYFKIHLACSATLCNLTCRNISFGEVHINGIFQRVSWLLHRSKSLYV